MNKKIYIIMPVPEMGWEIPNNLAYNLIIIKNWTPKRYQFQKKFF